jgi:hypothetical protein
VAGVLEGEAMTQRAVLHLALRGTYADDDEAIAPATATEGTST